MRTQARQNSLVANMYAVEVADGGDAAPVPGPQVMSIETQQYTDLQGRPSCRSTLRSPQLAQAQAQSEQHRQVHQHSAHHQ